jgi:hypothetical protein
VGSTSTSTPRREAGIAQEALEVGSGLVVVGREVVVLDRGLGAALVVAAAAVVVFVVVGRAGVPLGVAGPLEHAVRVSAVATATAVAPRLSHR